MSHSTQQATSTGHPGPSVQPQAAQGSNPGPSQGAALQTAMTVWVAAIHDWYPYLHTRTYFLPPLHFNRVSYDVATVAGQSVLVPQPASSQPPQGPAAHYPAQPSQAQSPGVSVAGSMWPQQPSTPAPLTPVFDSDVRDDSAMERFLQCLRVLADDRKEVMMVISELDFRKYLDDQIDPINTAACALLPRPATMAPKYRRGDFDVLIIHRHYGFIVAEVKSVGADLQNIPDLDKAIVSKVQRAVRQLDKEQTVLGHLMSDMAPVKVTKVMILPNVTSGQLLQALSTDAAVSQALCQCLNTQDLSVAVSRCLCADQMPPTEDLHVVNSTAHLSKWARLRRVVLRRLPWLRVRLQSTTISKLFAWWRHAVVDAGPDPNMSSGLYEQLLARFCGPATTVDIPTVTSPRKVVRSEAQAVAETGLTVSSLALYPGQVDLLNRQLPRVFLWGAPGTGKTIILVLKALQLLNQQKDTHVISLCEEGQTVTILMEQQIRHTLGAAPAAGRLHRHHFDLFAKPGAVTAAVNKLATISRGTPLYIIVDEYNIRSELTEFCRQLDALVPHVSIWAAGVERPNHLPLGMSLEKLTVPLRSPPVVVREIKLSRNIGVSPNYSSTLVPAATDGPAVRWLQHRGQPGHSGDRPEKCEQCGRNIATVLRELRVGETGHGLQWRDMIVLCENPRSTVPMVLALRGSGVPVGVVERDNTPEADLRDLALALTDHVVVAHMDTVSGLERRVVVGMTMSVGLENRERLLALSRCSAQLVWIDEPAAA